MSDSRPDPVLGRAITDADHGVLDTFPVEQPVSVRFETHELEALCPAVDHVQPDIYHCAISYVAEERSIESKSLKLWLVTFRDRRIFAENLAAQIGTRIETLEGLRLVSVELRQNVRGGLEEHVRYPALR